MNAAAHLVLFDTTTLSSFAAIDRLDLLATCFVGRAAWTVVVAHELRRGRRHEKYLRDLNTDWLGLPREPPAGPEHLSGVQRIRRAISGSTRNSHDSLGEAETIYYIETCARGATFITDDRVAGDMAKRRGIRTHNTPWVLGRIHSAGQLTCPEPYELLLAMNANGRHLQVPADHTRICP